MIGATTPEGLWTQLAQELDAMRPRPQFMAVAGLAVRPCLVLDPGMLVAANDPLVVAETEAEPA